MSRVALNADLGEAVGLHSFGNDDALLEIVDSVNVACGMHAGDPGEMQRVVRAAMARGVTIGAHPGLPDLVGFGRRAMALDEDEVRDLVRYQVGALVAFIEASDGELHHIKPHGALFGMTMADPALMRGVCEVARQYRVGVYGLAGTAHESVAAESGVRFFSEFYVDLDYDDEGRLVLERRAKPTHPEVARRRTRDAVESGIFTTVSGAVRTITPDTVCVHSDLPNAVEVARVVREQIDVLSR